MVLGTGGTIAGRRRRRTTTSATPRRKSGSTELLGSIAALEKLPLAAEQVAQIDSKDMELRRSGARWPCGAAHWLAQRGRRRHRHHPRHRHAGGDRVLPAGGAGARQAGGADLRDAAGDGRWPPMDRRTCWMPWRWPRQTVRAAWSLFVPGAIHGAADVAKQHTYRLDAFSSGDAGPIGYVEEGRLRLTRNWPRGRTGHAGAHLASNVHRKPWPRVEIVMSHAGASGARRRCAGCARAVGGLVVAATGNGTLHHELEAALIKAQAARREDPAGDALRAGQGDRTPR